MITKENVKISWANEELAQIINQLKTLYTEYQENSGLIQHELIEQAIDKLYHAYTLSKPNNNLNDLLIVDSINNVPLQVDHFN